MTLKEKFKQIDIELSKNHTTKIVDFEAQIIEQIADEFAIGFAEWISMRCYITKDDSYWLVRNEGDIKKNSKELLEIYKKEKGL